MDRAPTAGESLETEQLRQLGAEERLIMREDGAIVLDDEDEPWSDVELTEPCYDPDTIDLDLDDACVICVEEVRAEAVASPPAAAPPRTDSSPPPPPGTPARPRGRAIGRITPVRDPKRDVLRAIVAGNFAQAQQALGHQPKARVASKPPPRRSPKK